MGLVNSISSRNQLSTLCGGRHQEIKENVESLFKQLKPVSNLVFFEDGSVEKLKEKTWLKRSNDKYDRCINVLNCIYKNMPLNDIIHELSHKLVNINTHLETIEYLARMYGELIIAITTECDSEIAQYANKNKNVFAILADDSDFLIYAGNWRYFSLDQLDFETLNSKEYNRVALREYLDLSEKGLVVLSTISGNDLTKNYDFTRFL